MKARILPKARPLLRLSRQKLGLSQSDLGARLQVSGQTISALERGEHSSETLKVAVLDFMVAHLSTLLDLDI